MRLESESDSLDSPGLPVWTKLTANYCSACGRSVQGANFCPGCGESQSFPGVVADERGAAEVAVPLRSMTDDWWGLFERAFSIRVACYAFFTSLVLLFGLVLVFPYSDLVSDYGHWVLIGGTSGTCFLIGLNGDQTLKCARCRRRVKLGATA